MTEQHLDADDLVALALRDLEPGRAAELHRHLEECWACRGDYTAIDLDIRHALAAAPAIAPPPGFSARVLDQMGLSGQPAPTTSSRRTVLLVAAGVAAGALLGTGATMAVMDRAPDPGTPVPIASAALLTAAGEQVGSVGLVRMDGRERVLVNVSRGRPGVAYDCVLVDRDGRRSTVGRYTMDTPQAAWLVDAPAAGVRRLELLTTTGNLWSSADL